MTGRVQLCAAPPLTGLLALGARPDFQIARLGPLAADVLARAVARGVYAATPWPDAAVPCWRDLA